MGLKSFCSSLCLNGGTHNHTLRWMPHVGFQCPGGMRSLWGHQAPLCMPPCLLSWVATAVSGSASQRGVQPPRKPGHHAAIPLPVALCAPCHPGCRHLRQPGGTGTGACAPWDTAWSLACALGWKHRRRRVGRHRECALKSAERTYRDIGRLSPRPMFFSLSHALMKLYLFGAAFESVFPF